MKFVKGGARDFFNGIIDELATVGMTSAPRMSFASNGDTVIFKHGFKIVSSARIAGSTVVVNGPVPGTKELTRKFCGKIKSLQFTAA